MYIMEVRKDLNSICRYRYIGEAILANIQSKEIDPCEHFVLIIVAKYVILDNLFFTKKKVLNCVIYNDSHTKLIYQSLFFFKKLRIST